MDNFVETLSELMIKYSLNAKQLAKNIGISNVYISRWFAGKNQISLKHLIMLADYFQCSIDYLLRRSDEYLPFTIYPLVPFSKRIREVMKEKGYSRYRFVNETRFTKSHIYKWDKGSIPQLPTFIELAGLFECSIDYLIGRER